MPPKKTPKRKDKLEPSKTCTGKDITQLKDFADNNDLPRNFLAYMLEKDGFLEKFGLHPSFFATKLALTPFELSTSLMLLNFFISF